MIFFVFLVFLQYSCAYRGRPQRLHIIDPSETEPTENLRTLQDINSQNLASFVGDLNGGTESNEKALLFLARYGLLVNERKCPHSPNSDMSLVSDKSVQFGMFWRCKSTNTTSKVMIRDGSFFEGSKLSIQKTLLLAADWAESPGRSTAATSKLYQVNHETVIHLHRSFRRLTEQWVAREMGNSLKLGGVGKIVELDESHMFKAKHHRGRMLSRRAVWIFGLVERGSNKVLMFRVAKRDATTLLPLIKENVLNGTLIVSDGWSAYGGISQIQANFTHRWVNHKVNFVNPGDRRIHTQSIEATWGAFKRELKAKFGIPEENLGEYMSVYMFRRFFGRDRLLNNLLIEMKEFGRRRSGTADESDDDEGSDDDDGSDDDGGEESGEESEAEGEEEEDEDEEEEEEEEQGYYRDSSENDSFDEMESRGDRDEAIEQTGMQNDFSDYSDSERDQPGPSNARIQTRESESESDNGPPPPKKRGKAERTNGAVHGTRKKSERGRNSGARRRPYVEREEGMSENSRHGRGQSRRRQEEAASNLLPTRGRSRGRSTGTGLRPVISRGGGEVPSRRGVLPVRARARSSTGGTPRGGTLRGGPSRGGPSRGGPSRGGPSRGGPSRGGPSRGGPSRGGPSRGGTSRGGPSRGGPSRGGTPRGGPSRGGTGRGRGTNRARSSGIRQSVGRPRGGKGK